MKVRDIERLLAANGIGPAKMDTVTRRLRECGELPVAARGFNAPDVTAEIAAKVLIAAAGSGKGVAADRRLRLLSTLKSKDNRKSFLDRLARLLTSSAKLDTVAECRVGRNIREASILFTDGTLEKFTTSTPRDYESRLKVEGVIPGNLLRTIAKLVSDRASVPAPSKDSEPDSDS